MKKILPFLLLLSLGARSQTSVYHPFLDSSALLNFDRDFFCQFFLQYEHYSIQITGDTTISNQTRPLAPTLKSGLVVQNNSLTNFFSRHENYF